MGTKSGYLYEEQTGICMRAHAWKALDNQADTLTLPLSSDIQSASNPTPVHVPF